jgi:TPR repeat protein
MPMSNERPAAAPRSGSEAGSEPPEAGRSFERWATSANPRRLRILVALLAVTVVWYGVYLGMGGGDFDAWYDVTAQWLGVRSPPPVTADRLPRTPPRAVMIAGYGSRNARPLTAEDVRRIQDAADRGDANALFRMGVIRQYGRGGFEPDLAEAARYYAAASDKGHARAQVNLGILYETGTDAAERDIREAVRLFRAAAAQGDIVAQYHLSFIYMFGRGDMPADESEAVAFLKPLADRNDPDGLYLLGVLYLKGGGGLDRDRDKAIALLRIAAESGHEHARQMLRSLHAE